MLRKSGLSFNDILEHTSVALIIFEDFKFLKSSKIMRFYFFAIWDAFKDAVTGSYLE